MSVRTITTVGVSFAVAATMSFAAPQQAEAREWNMCNWEEIPAHVLNRITNRADFDDILRRMFDNCADAALGLTDRPTASLSNLTDERRSASDRDSDESGAGTDSADATTGDNDGESGATGGGTSGGAGGDGGTGGDGGSADDGGDDGGSGGDGGDGGSGGGGDSGGPGPGGPGGGLSLG
ncbi:MAG: hypothetical protein AAF636_02940 [Pseudomonadota bacterium]